MTMLWGFPLSLWAILLMVVGLTGIVGVALFWPEHRYERERRRIKPQRVADVVNIAARAERKRKEIRQSTTEVTGS